MFSLLAMTLVLGMGILFSVRGPRIALWVGWLATIFLAPTWAVVFIGPFTLDLRTIAAVVGLAGLWWAGLGRTNRWLWADLVVGLLIVVQVASEGEAGDLGPLRIPEILRQWALPYLVGRFFLGTLGDRQTLLPIVATTVLAASIFGIVEAVVRINPVNVALGQSFGYLEGPEGFRWGLKRAQGFLSHPIYFGYALALFLPWTFEARGAALRGKGPAWWRYLPLTPFACLFVTGSRGAIVVGGLAALFPWALERIRRSPLVIAGLLLPFGLLFVFEEELLSGLSLVAEETDTTVHIAGEEMQYTGTSHRLLLFQAYEQPIAELGLLGYGSQLRELDTEGLPGVFNSIDNHYLRFLLQFGPVAIGLFLTLAGLTLVSLARRTGEWSASLCGAMAGVTVMLFTVWFAPDFGSVWLFLTGLAGNLTVLDERSATAAMAHGDAGAVVRRRLLPAYAPLPE